MFPFQFTAIMSDEVEVYYQLGQLEGDFVLMEKGAKVRAFKDAILRQHPTELEGVERSNLKVFRSLSTTEIVSNLDEIPPSALKRSTMLSVTVDPDRIKKREIETKLSH